MPATASRGHLWVSHADREQVIGILKAAFAQGRITAPLAPSRQGQLGPRVIDKRHRDTEAQK